MLQLSLTIIALHVTQWILRSSTAENSCVCSTHLKRAGNSHTTTLPVSNDRSHLIFSLHYLFRIDQPLLFFYLLLKASRAFRLSLLDSAIYYWLHETCQYYMHIEWRRGIHNYTLHRISKIQGRPKASCVTKHLYIFTHSTLQPSPFDGTMPGSRWARATHCIKCLWHTQSSTFCTGVHKDCWTSARRTLEKKQRLEEATALSADLRW
jgi:hypothetical protein